MQIGNKTEISGINDSAINTGSQVHTKQTNTVSKSTVQKDRKTKKRNYLALVSLVSFSLLILLTLSYTVATTFGFQIPNDSVPWIRMSIAILFSFTMPFLCAKASVKMNIPFFKDKPAVSSITGGLAAFIIILLFLNKADLPTKEQNLKPTSEMQQSL